MPFNRREFLELAAAGATLSVTGSALAAGPKGKTKAIVFDAFTVFDIRPIAELANRLLPEKGKELEKLWRTRLFEYCWLRSVMGQYADFWKLMEDALDYAAAALKVDLDGENKRQLMQAYLTLKAWSDVAPMLAKLKAMGIHLAFLANVTPAMLDANIKSAGLGKLFDPHLTAETIRDYKPSPRAYKMAMDAYSLSKNEIVFVAFGAWDVAGAKWFGYPTYWANRSSATAEKLGMAADIESPDFSKLIDFVKS